MRKHLEKGFYTTESGGGKYCIKIAYESLADLHAADDELRAVLAQEAGKCEQQDNSALMKVAADLANRHPLRQLYLVCEHQGRINTDSLHDHLDKCGDLLAGIALDIRRAITSPPAPVSVVLPERKPMPDQATFVGGNTYFCKLFDEARGYNQALDDVQACLNNDKQE